MKSRDQLNPCIRGTEAHIIWNDGFETCMKELIKMAPEFNTLLVKAEWEKVERVIKGQNPFHIYSVGARFQHRLMAAQIAALKGKR